MLKKRPVRWANRVARRDRLFVYVGPMWRLLARAATVVAAGLALLPVSDARAAAGSLDPLFGDGGRVFTAIPSDRSWGPKMAITPSGEIVMAGDRDEYGGGFATVWLRPDGSQHELK